MEDYLPNGTIEETQKIDLQKEEVEEVVEAVENGVNGEEEPDENGPKNEAEEVSDLAYEAVEPVQSLSGAVTSEDSVIIELNPETNGFSQIADENNGSSMVATGVEEGSSSSTDFPQTGSVVPLLSVVGEGFEESTSSNADEKSNIGQEERDLDLKGTDKIKGPDLEDKTLENVENPELAATDNCTIANPPEPAISVAKRTSFLGCCGFLEVLRRSGR